VLALAQHATATLNFLTFWIYPVHACEAWEDNVANQKVEVNLWKTAEVSYPSTLGNSTQTRLLHSVDSSAKSPTNMVVQLSIFSSYRCRLDFFVGCGLFVDLFAEAFVAPFRMDLTSSPVYL